MFIFGSLALASFAFAWVANAVVVVLTFSLMRRVSALRGSGDDPAPGVAFNSFKEPWKGRGGHDAARFFMKADLGTVRDDGLRGAIQIYRRARTATNFAFISCAGFLTLAATQVCWGCR
jgi:hypothetical protein